MSSPLRSETRISVRARRCHTRPRKSERPMSRETATVSAMNYDCDGWPSGELPAPFWAEFGDSGNHADLSVRPGSSLNLCTELFKCDWRDLSSDARCVNGVRRVS